MAKQGSIKHYRQTGSAKAPPSLPFGELAVAKDGTLFVGNDKNLPVQSGMQMDLLWENASPQSSFAVQTIYLNLTKYKFVFVEVLFCAGMVCNSAILRVGVTGNVGGFAVGYTAFAHRNCVPTSTGVLFSSAYLAATENNAYAIPQKIYGINIG